MLSEAEARQKLEQIGQDHLLAHLSTLSSAEQERLLGQVSRLDLPLLAAQQKVLKQASEKKGRHAPLLDTVEHASKEAEQLGTKMLEEGKCGCLVMAGGAGSRLRHKGPKGTFPISVVKQKSLFQLLAEKVKAASTQVGRPLQLAIMTSPSNHVETETFFVQHAFFGLETSQVSFFYQALWPLLDFQGNLFLETPSQIALGPNGNGGIFRRFVDCDVAKKWKEKGVEHVQLISIDNPLARPFDAELLGLHALYDSEVTIKGGKRHSPKEDVGLLVEGEKGVEVVEYTELTAEEKEARDPQGELLFRCANFNLFCFDLRFVDRVSASHLPLHYAKKAVHCLDEEGQTILPETPNAWKFEEFLFDVLPLSHKTRVMLAPREECFAPLKNFQGDDSIATVQAALQAFDRKLFASISGREPPQDLTFELAPAFHYPTSQLLADWKGRELPNEGYIDVA